MQYDAKTLFTCSLCLSRKVLSESYPYMGKRICAECWDNILWKEREEQEGNIKETKK